MGFMVPELTQEDFVTFHDVRGEYFAVPEDVFGPDVLAAEVQKFNSDADLSTIELVRGKWWGRLTAPGYMDCTDWHGPYDSQAALEASLAEFYPCEAEPKSDVKAYCAGIDGHEGPHLFVVTSGGDQ